MAALPNSILDDTGGPIQLTGGQPENLATMAAQDYIDALDTLREIDDVNMVAIPDALTLTNPAIPPAGPTPDVTGITTVQQAIISHCEQLADRFARARCTVREPAPVHRRRDRRGRRSTAVRRLDARVRGPLLPVACVAPDGPGDNDLSSRRRATWRDLRPGSDDPRASTRRRRTSIVERRRRRRAAR